LAQPVAALLATDLSHPELVVSATREVRAVLNRIAASIEIQQQARERPPASGDSD
jgi:hypothetical protein